MNTVHREPRSPGYLARQAASVNSDRLRFIDEAEFCRNDPHPEEQASFNSIFEITPSLMKIDFISCPPISNTKDTLGSTYCAPERWAMVSTMP